MKKVITLITVITLLLSCVCVSGFAEGIRINEPFTLRKYIVYGMTKNDVMEAEQKNGIAKSKWYNCNDGSIECDKITLAGSSNSRLTYYFDSQTNMTIVYELTTYSERTKSKRNTIYPEIYSTLISKYGNPNWDSYLSTHKPPMLYGSNVVIESMDSWLVEYDDCYVNIQLWKWNNNNYFYCDVLYYVVSKGDMEAMWMQEQIQTEIENTQRNNDL